MSGKEDPTVLKVIHSLHSEIVSIKADMCMTIDSQTDAVCQMFQTETDSVKEEFCPVLAALKTTSETHSKKLMDLESAAANVSDLTTILLNGF